MAFDSVPPPNPFGGEPHKRIDGVAKVTGAARYATDEAAANPAFAYLVTSNIARGRVTGFDLAAAKSVPGYIDILTHENIGGDYKTPPFGGNPDGQTTTLESDQVWHDGQIVAVVLAESFEAAREAALTRSWCAMRSSRLPRLFRQPGRDLRAAQVASRASKDPKKGDASKPPSPPRPSRVDAHYSPRRPSTITPMELFATTCVWEGPKLTVYEGSPVHVGHEERRRQAAGDGTRPMCAWCRAMWAVASAPKAIDPAAERALIAIAARRLRRSGEAGRHPRPGLHHRHLPRRDQAST